MTDDLVRWLRANISMWDHDYGMQTEAADRIEKLEAALREAYTLLCEARLYRGYEGGPLSEPIAEMIERNCRNALEGKDD